MGWKIAEEILAKAPTNNRGGKDLKMNLPHMNFEGMDLQNADFYGSNLVWCSFRGANLEGARFLGTNLHYVILSGANLKNVFLGSPTCLLLCWWEELSPETTLALMRLDASAHPDPTAFDRWAEGKAGCPYKDLRFSRVAHFKEKKELWVPGPPPTILEAAEMVLDEKCPGWREI